MNNECGANKTFNFREHWCKLERNHEGNHFDYVSRFMWPQYQPADNPAAEEHVLRLTLEELKGLVYALSGPEWKEDEPELVAKIDKALKEAL